MRKSIRVLIILFMLLISVMSVAAESGDRAFSQRLFRAVQINDLSLITEFMALGDDPIAANNSGTSPLSLAVQLDLPFETLNQLLVGNLADREKIGLLKHLWRLHSRDLELVLASSLEVDELLSEMGEAAFDRLFATIDEIDSRYREPLEKIDSQLPELWETDEEFFKRIASERYLIEAERDLVYEQAFNLFWREYSYEHARYQALDSMIYNELARVREYEIPPESVLRGQFDRNTRKWPFTISLNGAPFFIDLEVEVDLSDAKDIRAAIIDFQDTLNSNQLSVRFTYTIERMQVPLRHRVWINDIVLYHSQNQKIFATVPVERYVSEFPGIDMLAAEPIVQAVDSNAIIFSAGDSFTLIVDDTGVLYGAGNNEDGQLGFSEPDEFYEPTALMDEVVAVAAGSTHALVVRSDGSLWATGYNYDGRLGNGTWSSEDTFEEVAYDVIAVSAGDEMSYHIKSDGSLWAAGSNYYGQLGVDEPDESYEWINVMDNVRSVSAGGYHALVITEDDRLYAFGENDAGQLGDGTFENSYEPLLIMEDVKDASAGWEHSMVLKNDGSLWAMGSNSYGQLGIGSYDNQNQPMLVAEGVKAVSAGRYAHTMFITEDGELWAMGSNSTGELGIETYGEQAWPVFVMDGVSAVSCGAYHSVVMTVDGMLYVTGQNDYGQFGNGTEEGSSEFIPMYWPLNDW
ncbi:MAG: hypothetical protein WC129_05680 [Sphaerochaetaceae bacterium]|nr:hypothetical protein [Sphaerochaetaceae bacterium]